MYRLMLVRLTKKLFLMLLLGFLFLGAVLPQVISAKSLTSSSDPRVLVALDATSQAKTCTETFVINVQISRQTTTTIHCPLGTIVKSAIVPLSFAREQHKKYIVLPASALTSDFWKKHSVQVTDLLSAIKPKQPMGAVHPYTGCGKQSTATLKWAWFDNTGYYYSSVTYYRSSDCSSIYFDKATAANDYPAGDVDTGTYWYYDLYAGSQFNVPGEPYLVSGGGSAWHGINLGGYAPGYGYDEYFYCFCGSGSSGYIHNNMTPID